MSHPMNKQQFLERWSKNPIFKRRTENVARLLRDGVLVGLDGKPALSGKFAFEFWQQHGIDPNTQADWVFDYINSFP